MDVGDRLVISVMDRNDSSRLIQLVSRQLGFLVLVQELTFVQVSPVVVGLANNGSETLGTLLLKLRWDERDTCWLG